VQIRPAIPVVQILGRVRSPGPPVGTVIPEGPAQRQDRSSSLRCGRSVLTTALTQCCLPGGRKPAKPLVHNPVDTTPSLQGWQCPPPNSRHPTVAAQPSGDRWPRATQRKLGTGSRAASVEQSV